MKNLMEGWRGYLKENAGEQEEREDLMQMIRDYSKELTGRRDNYGDPEMLSKMSLEQLQEYYQGMFDSPEAQYMADKIKDEEDAALGQDDEYDMMPTQSGMGRGLREGDYNQQWKLFLEDCWDGYERVPGTKEGEKGSCRKKTDEAKKDKDPCWDGYEQVGMKEKDGKEVPNCVPKQNESVGGPPKAADGYYIHLNRTPLRVVGGSLKGAEGKAVETTTTTRGETAIVIELTKDADQKVFGKAGDEVIVRAGDVQTIGTDMGDDPKMDYYNDMPSRDGELREGGSMAEYGKIDAEDGNPPSKIGRGNPEYMEAYNAVLIARGEEPLDVQQPDQAYLDALHSGRLEEALYKILSEGGGCGGKPASMDYDEGPEASMHRTSLAVIANEVQDLLAMIRDADDLPEWVEAKITKAKASLSAAKDYIAGEQARELGALEEALDEVVYIEEGGQCDGPTKKASSTAKGKKWMQCVKNPDGKGYKRVHWGQKGVRATGKSGDTKRKKSFRKRHKCSSAKAGTPRAQACKDW